MDRKIMIVDDEGYILNALRRLFIKTPYDVMYVSTPAEALTKVNESAFDMVIADMRMPEMDGVSLLKEIRVVCPEAIRVILSGYADKDMIFKICQAGTAKFFLMKPWENDELLHKIDAVFKAQELMQKHSIFKIVNALPSFPTIKESHDKIQHMIDNDVSMEVIAGEIEKDPAITTNILKVVNSAFYGMHLNTLKQAIAFLGMASISNILLGVQIFSAPSEEASISRMKINLWNHSNYVNNLSNRIIKEFSSNESRQRQQNNSIGGLLHDVGKIAMMMIDSKAYWMITNADKLHGVELELAEAEHFGFTHSQVGGYLLDWWGVSYSDVEVALFHHDSLNTAIINNKQVVAVGVADAVINHGSDCFELQDEYLEIFEIDQERWQLFMQM